MKIRWQIVARCGNAPIRNEKCHRSLRPAGSSGSCSSWHLRSTVAASRTSLYRKLHQHSSPRLSRSRGAGHLFLSLASFIRVLPFSLILVLIHTVIHVRTCCTSCTALEPCIYKYVHRIAAHINDHSLSLFVPSATKQLPERQTEIPRSPCHPKLQDSERSRAQDYFSMRLADSSSA